MNLCRYTGHKARKGHNGDIPYGRPRYYTTDGMNVQHFNVEIECEKCGEMFVLCKIHGPLDARSKL